MSTQKRNSKLESATARLKLPIARGVHWVALAPGIHLGYRRCRGAGSWSVRNAAGRIKRIALADDYEPASPPVVLDYWQAQEAARLYLRGAPDVPVDPSLPVTVSEALHRYEADLRARGGRTYNARWPRHYLSATLLKTPVQMLSAAELKRWRDSLITGTSKTASINRMLKVLRAALTLAAEHDPRIRNHDERKVGLRGLPDARRDRNVILNDDQVRAIIAAAYAHDRALGLLVEVLAVTGTRPSQAAGLGVGDLIVGKAPRLMMPHSGKGGSRNRVERKTRKFPVPITAALALKLKGAAAGRTNDAPLLLDGAGTPWCDGYGPSNRYRKPVQAIVAAVGLDPAVVTMYALRHSSIVRHLLGNIPIRLVATAHDTSVAMIEAHYSRHIAEHSDEISRRVLLQGVA